MRRQIQIHPEAAIRINELSQSLIKSTQPYIEPQRNPLADNLGVTKISAEDILSYEMTGFTRNRRTVGFVFDGPEQTRFCVREPDFDYAEKIADLVINRDNRDFVHRETVFGVIRQWLKENMQESQNPTALSVYLCSTIKITQHEILLPISDLHLGELEIRAYGISIKSLVISDVETLLSNLKNPKNDDESLAKKFYHEQFQKYMQGSVAEIIVTADERIASEYAVNRVRELLSLLRIFTSGNLSLDFSCPFDVGNITPQPTYDLVSLDNGVMKNTQSTIYGEPRVTERLTPDSICKMNQLGLGVYLHLFSLESRNGYEKKLYDAAVVYGTAAAKTDSSEKLVSIFTALEMILLSNKSEPIVEAVSIRLAFLTESTVKKRRTVIAAVKKAYGLRSAFVHHGQRSSTELDVMEQFLRSTWIAFSKMTEKVEEFKSHTDFIEWLEDQKLT